MIEKINKNEILELSFLGHAAIRLPELIAIAKALKNNISVLSIDLGGNLIGDAGAAALAGVLMEPDCSVQTLHLGRNYIRDAGAAALAEDPYTDEWLLNVLRTINSQRLDQNQSKQDLETNPSLQMPGDFGGSIPFSVRNHPKRAPFSWFTTQPSEKKNDAPPDPNRSC